MRKNSQSSITKTLSGASYSLVVSDKRRKLWIIPLLALILSGAVYAFLPSQASPELSLRTTIENLKQENLRLTQELKQQGMSFQHEQATRESVERQLAMQGEELKKARKDLSFYRENAARQGQ
ncbi:hypothetical protein Q9Q94_07960 [Uliginosibacterium sp. 31-16]|uniref:hypothetical protein n=1 Tax=Uliginosibacterium sp. 31-16 TaxID=3068315 RepID=UPI00273D195C|nr:hypothetical protein [Uliginosibacterium sp. 31-16]MDP5239460.1 hypothetical protein [Uliginosibacterium sp. 31-16]